MIALRIHPKPSARKFADLDGRRFGRLTVIGFAGKERYVPKWWCRCDCGNTAKPAAYSLLKGETQSCGCLQRERSAAAATRHGLRSHPLYKTWKDMRARCLSPSNASFPSYGGRGISVCDRWRFGEGGKGGFECFVEDMGPRPPGHTLDRYPDNDGNYEPGNCRWASAREQARNRRTSRAVIINGSRMTLAEACERLGRNYEAVHRRIVRHGWEAERALGVPRC